MFQNLKLSSKHLKVSQLTNQTKLLNNDFETDFLIVIVANSKLEDWCEELSTDLPLLYAWA